MRYCVPLLLLALLVGCSRRGTGEFIVEYYARESGHDVPSYHERLVSPPGNRGYHKVLRGRDGQISQVVSHGESDGRTIFEWYMDKYFYADGKLRYIAMYVTAPSSEPPWSLKSVFDVATGKWLGTVRLAGEFDDRAYLW